MTKSNYITQQGWRWGFTLALFLFCGENGQLIKVGSNGWSSTNVAFLGLFLSVYMTKLYETEASELSIVALLHDYSFFIITI